MTATDDWEEFRSKPTPKLGPFASSRSGRWFSVVIGVLVLGWIVGFRWIGQVFGWDLALLLFLTPALPIGIAIRLRLRCPAVLARELVMMTVIGVVAVGAVAYVVQNWYGHGFHHDHAEDMRYAYLESLMRRDSAFRDVRLLPRLKKGCPGLVGRVASRADLDRLAALALQSGIKVTDRDRPFRDEVDLPGEPPSSTR